MAVGVFTPILSLMALLDAARGEEEEEEEEEKEKEEEEEEEEKEKEEKEEEEEKKEKEEKEKDRKLNPIARDIVPLRLEGLDAIKGNHLAILNLES